MVYTANDIEAYYSGKLPPSRMHAMEKDALDDHFLAEAMEGYEAMKAVNLDPQLLALHRHFEEEKEAAKIIPLTRSGNTWWRVAAAILIIGCGATLTWILSNKKTGSGSNSEITQQLSPPITVPATSQKNSEEPIAKTNEPAIQNDKNIKNPVLSKPPVFILPSATTDQTVIAAPAQKQAPVSDDTRSTTIGMDKNKDMAVVPPANNNAAASIARTEPKQEQKPPLPNKNQPTVNRNFIAQVVGPDNTPLPFANVNIKNENFGTYADVKGNFRLVSTDSLINVEVRSVGYLPRTYTLHSSQSPAGNLTQNKIVLTEDQFTAKEKSVVTDVGFASNKNSRRVGVLRDTSFKNVEPADGWDNYNAYIANNLAIPENAMKNDFHGEVEVTFKVHPNGAVTDITTSQSDCADCAELAKRLIEQGPQWKIKKGIRKTSARIKVRF